jgi:TBC1 domain family member 5
MASSSTYSAFPLTDERPPEERPPWEPRSRFEMEREITDLRAMNKKLGKSVGWIVDALLQDESEAKDSQELNSIKTRKREALESLSYVRDVLVGNADKVDDSLLVGEEELKTRRSREISTKPQELPGAEVSRPASVPVHEGRPKRASAQLFSYTRTPSPVNRIPSPRLPPSTTSMPSSYLSHNNPNKPTRLAPWNYTRSDFSAGVTLPAATLPRLPPPTSVNFHHPSVSTSSARAAPLPSQNPGPTRETPNDPLGVLP